jgi:hypothetical protein
MSKDIMEMNAGELRVLRDGLADDHNPQEVRLLNDRITDVSIAEGLASGLSKAKKIRTAEKLDEAAYDRYPGLRDEESEFAKAVNKELEARGDVDTNERALADASNAVAIEMGIKPEAWSQSSAGSAIRGSGVRQPLGDPEEKEGMSDTQKSLLAGLATRGFINTADKDVMARINKATGESNDE